MNLKYIIAGALLFAPAAAFGQAHAGQTDTDGILSPGERENAHIDYDRAQRQAESIGDPRVDNPDNDAAAAEDREIKRDSRGRLGWQDRDYDERQESDRYRDNRPWWQWW